MKEIRDIVNAYDRAAQAGRKAALATVVCVEGSSYRRPGAKMLVTDDGQLTGAISGGCLEGDALRKALLAIEQGENKLVTYDTTDEEDARLGVQLGCSGIIHILFEPIQPEAAFHPIQLLREVLCRREEAVLVTLYAPADRRQPGTSLLCRKEMNRGDLLLPFREEVAADAAAVLYGRASRIRQYRKDGRLTEALLEYLPVPIAVVIAGAGNDVLPLAAMTRLLGWHTTIADGRPAYVNRQRFPAAEQLLVARPEELPAQVVPDERTAVVLMTHNYNYDYALVAALLPSACPYIGLLGPRKKRERIVAELVAEGHNRPDLRKRLFGPVGLDIGAETPEEIAVSIVAEIQSVMTGARGQSLKDKETPIHARESRTLYE